MQFSDENYGNQTEYEALFSDKGDKIPCDDADENGLNNNFRPYSTKLFWKQQKATHRYPPPEEATTPPRALKCKQKWKQQQCGKRAVDIEVKPEATSQTVTTHWSLVRTIGTVVANKQNVDIDRKDRQAVE